MEGEELLEQLRAVISGRDTEEAAVKIAEKIVEAGIDVELAIDLASQAIRAVGDEFESGKIFLPELMIAARKMERCMAILKPHIKAGREKRVGGRIVIGTVCGDIHDIGKNLVATMLSVGGFDIYDLGINVSPMNFVSSAKEKKADIIGLSSLMTTTLPYQEEVIDLLKEFGLRERYYVIVGGGSVTAEFAFKAGADGWADNAAGAVRLCEGLMRSGETPPLAETLVL